MIVAILQARSSSSRLPGKVLLPVHGEPMLIRQIERVSRSARISKLIVATSTHETDTPLAALCERHKVEVFRGSLDDVLDRFYRAAIRANPDYVVRLTGDCPLADPAVMDAVIDFCIAGGYDYASNALEPTFPDGLDVEVMKVESLREAWTHATLPSQREHVTPYLYQGRDRFRVGSYMQPKDLSRLRWTVDEKADYDFICAVYDALYPGNAAFTSEDVLRFLASRPDLAAANAAIGRNEGYIKSLKKDEAFVDKTAG